MKRLIALLMAVVWCVVIFSTPVSALCRDPFEITVYSGEPNRPLGDDSGWGEPVDTAKKGRYELLWSYKQNLPFALGEFILITLIKNLNTLDNNDTENLTEPGDNRRAGSR